MGFPYIKIKMLFDKHFELTTPFVSGGILGWGENLCLYTREGEWVGGFGSLVTKEIVWDSSGKKIIERGKKLF